MSPTRFIEDALFCSDPFALSYSDPDQKWVIRQHLISLLHDFPSLKPSVALFTHNDGSDVTLFRASGHLSLPTHAPPVPLIVWVHELYPHAPPLVYINLLDSPYPIYDRYPFADPASGAVTAAYISSWSFTMSSLSGMAHNLVKLFSHNHPFYYTATGSSGRWAHPSCASKMEAIDRLTSSIHCDAAEIMAETAEEIENLAAVQARLKERSAAAADLVSELERERRCLKSRSDALCGEADRLLNWLKVYAAGNSIWRCGGGVDDAFEGSEKVIELMAADMAAEDLMFKLEKAVEEGVVSFDVYMKQVRILARDQFLHRHKMLNHFPT